jgi:hypothetical protein
VAGANLKEKQEVKLCGQRAGRLAKLPYFGGGDRRASGIAVGEQDAGEEDTRGDMEAAAAQTPLEAQCQVDCWEFWSWSWGRRVPTDVDDPEQQGENRK